MSVCNLNFSGDHVWLVSDTAQFDQDGRAHSFGMKASIYANVTSLAGFRGLSGLHQRLDRLMLGGTFLERGLETAVELLPGELRQERAELVELLAKHGRATDGAKGQIYIAGWLPTERIFGAFRLDSTDDFTPERLEPGTYLAPGPDGFKAPAVLAGPQLLVETVEAQRQSSVLNVKHGGADLGIGGDVILIELTRAGFTVRKAARLPDYAELVAQMKGES